MGSKTYSPVARTAIARLQKDFDAFVKRCEGAELDAAADMYQYAYVRLCGLLEQALVSLGLAVATRLAQAEAQAFGLSHLTRFDRNPRDVEILKYVARFSDVWAEDLRAWFEIDDRGDRINSLVGIRNGIAHGSSFGGSKTWFADYYVVVYELLDRLLDRFDPKPK
jgi:hypothetical protein